MDFGSDVESITLVECATCGRHFQEDIINRHKVVCIKNSTKKRKPFDSTKQRLQGIEEKNQNILGGASGIKSVETARKIAQVEARKHQWRKKHEEFISAIRAAKEYTVAKQTGKPLPPPPPPAIDPDLIQCEYCLRRFNEKAAERHIKFCREKHSRLPTNNASSNTTGIGRLRATTRTTAPANIDPTIRKNRKGSSTSYTQNNYGLHTNDENHSRTLHNTNSTRNTKHGIPQLVKPTQNPSITGVRNSSELRKNQDEMIKSHISSNNPKEETLHSNNKRGLPSSQMRQPTHTSKTTSYAQNSSKGVTNDKSNKVCSECGYKFPTSAVRFCPECGVRRMVV
ncbi:unnamed protein product [Schistosoma mattheei]|uniref:Zinc finger C2HC domain-containing protein 1B n=1 Tax=Schistosoma mattheei TaxID=31246 RepID=A0AA85BEV9_9TREM|nr:unnamed protein product [Schistosoma mattheei]